MADEGRRALGEGFRWLLVMYEGWVLGFREGFQVMGWVASFLVKRVQDQLGFRTGSGKGLGFGYIEVDNGGKEVDLGFQKVWLTGHGEDDVRQRWKGLRPWW